MPRVKTIAELRNELAAKEGQLSKLKARRAKAVAELAVVAKKIATLGGKSAKPAPAPKKAKKVAGKKRGRKPGPKPKGRRKGAKTLAQVISQVLRGVKGGMRVKDICAAVIKAGYKTKSKDFYNTTAATLAANKSFKKIKRGVYTL